MSEVDFFGKKVLVSGASGFVGTHLVRKLVQLGALIRGTTYSKKPPLPIGDAEYIACDLTRIEDCLEVTKGIDYVFMAAANTSGAEIIQQTPLVHLTPNVVMNAQMLAAAYENNVEKFCFISSNTVYPVTDNAVKEDDAKYEFFEKYFIVGWMKQFSELMCNMYSQKIVINIII